MLSHNNTNESNRIIPICLIERGNRTQNRSLFSLWCLTFLFKKITAIAAIITPLKARKLSSLTPYSNPTTKKTINGIINMLKVIMRKLLL